MSAWAKEQVELPRHLFDFSRQEKRIRAALYGLVQE
jgi:hypothetical protein